jgi:hypothetical protein
MRCEPWMNKTPIPTRTPKQIAKADMQYWQNELQIATGRVADCQRWLAEATARYLKEAET